MQSTRASDKAPSEIVPSPPPRTPAPTPGTGNAAPLSPWAPLAIPVFRALWIAAVASNIGTWMQNVAAAWQMTTINPSPLLVALLQTATSLPIFLLGLPAGALADVLDRRKLLLATQAWMLGTAALLAALTFAGAMSEWSLLSLTFLMGLGGALNGPAWQAIVPELVGRRQLLPAVALNSAGFNVARAVGPALGGLVVAAAGPGWVFLLNALSFLGVMIVLYRWRRHHEENNLPAEDILGAIGAGVRYVRHAPALQAVLVRTVAFIVPAAALWALMPVVARQELGLDATGYGILLGSIGLGAVIGTAFLPRLQAAMPVDRLIAASTLLFAISTLALGFVPNAIVVNFFMLLGGVAWIALMSSLNVAAQTAAPPWVRARALGLYQSVFQGGIALGSLAWGVLASKSGDPTALLAASVVMVAGLLVALRWPLNAVLELDFTPSLYMPEPRLLVTPDPEDGPVLVEVEYRVAREMVPEFARTMEQMKLIRRRDGAVRWRLYRDTADPDRYVEAFVVPSWAEHIRQHARTTVADEAVNDRVASLEMPGTERKVTHMIAVEET